jgi:hypothetical protein
MTQEVEYYEQRIRDLLHELYGLDRWTPESKRLRKELRQWEVKLQNLNREM